MRIRKARKSDKDEILPFCTRTFSWGDYIDKVWDIWLTNKKGRLLVAESGGNKIAVAHVAICPGNKQAWLEGVRVRPDYRRSKVATGLLQRMLAYAGRRGVRQAAAIVAEENIASQRMLEKSGFSVISRWVYYSTGEKMQERKTAARFAGTSDLPNIWQYLQHSKIYRLSAGRYVRTWRWYALDRKTLQKLIEDRRVVVTGIPVQGIAVVNSTGYWDRKDVLQIVYLDSKSSRYAHDLVLFAANLYTKEQYSHLHVICQNSRCVTSVIKRFQIDESEQFLLYSKIFTE